MGITMILVFYVMCLTGIDLHIYGIAHMKVEFFRLSVIQYKLEYGILDNGIKLEYGIQMRATGIFTT